jgi:hypothetical protein
MPQKVSQLALTTMTTLFHFQIEQAFSAPSVPAGNYSAELICVPQHDFDGGNRKKKMMRDV